MKRSHKPKRVQCGFTLVELMLVVIIIGVLAAMVVPSLVGRARKARVAAAKSDITAGLGTGLDLFEQDTGAYPTTAQGLEALIKAPEGVAGWDGPYLKANEIPVDPWGNEYKYTCPGVENTATYDLVSFGGDGKEGGGDDIANYSKRDR